MKIRTNEAKWSEKEQRWKINVTNSDGKRKTFNSSVGVKSRKGKLQAERKADEWLEQGLSSTQMRVEDAFEQYISYLKDTTSTGMWGPYKSIGKNWVCKILGRKKISALTEGDCETVIAEAYKAGRSKKYLQNIRSCTTSFLKYCRKRHLTDLRPEELKVPKGAKAAKKSVLTPDEIRFLFEPSDCWYIHAYRFFLLSDLRPGELLALRWEDINGDVYTVNRSINDNREITGGKNFNAHRSLRMIPAARQELDAQREMLKRNKMVTPWVFPCENGVCSKQNHFRLAWYAFCRKNGIGQRGTTKAGNPKYITPYEFRHTCYSVNKEMPESLKKMAFGHSRKFDGDSVYNHEMDGDMDAIVAYSTEAFSRILCPEK